jgi:putative sterol carrier protein
MADPTAEFFDGLAQRGYEPLLAHASGTMRFDIASGKKTESWLLAIDKGKLTVSRSGGAADATFSAGKTEFDRLVRGQENAVAAVLRGTLSVDGSMRLIVQFRRILTGQEIIEPPTAARRGRSRR